MGASSFRQVAMETCLFAIRTRCGAFLIASAGGGLSRRGAPTVVHRLEERSESQHLELCYRGVRMREACLSGDSLSGRVRLGN